MVLCGLHFVHSGPVLLRESFTLSKLSVISKQLNLLNGREPIFCERWTKLNEMVAPNGQFSRVCIFRNSEILDQNVT